MKGRVGTFLRAFAPFTVVLHVSVAVPSATKRNWYSMNASARAATAGLAKRRLSEEALQCQRQQVHTRNEWLRTRDHRDFPATKDKRLQIRAFTTATKLTPT